MRKHIDDLGSEFDKVAQRAERWLNPCYLDIAVQDLISACSSGIPNVCFRAVWVLGHTEVREAFNEIRRLCDDLDEEVQYDAVVALGIHGDDRSIADLLSWLLTECPSRPGFYPLTKIGPKCISRATGVREPH